MQEQLSICEKNLMDKIERRNSHPDSDISWHRNINHIIDKEIEQINDFNEVIEKWTK
jgi:hypothetical protein